MHCNDCNKYRKFKLTNKVSYIFKETLSPFIVYNNGGQIYEKIFKEEKSIEISMIPGLINNIEEYQKKYDHV